MRDQRVGPDVGQHRRLEEAAAERVALAAGDDFRAALHGIGNVLLDLVDRLHVDQRALHDAGFRAVADLHRCDLLRKFFDELVVDLVLGVEAVGADAGLPHVAILGDNGALDRRIDIGVVEHHERRVAAELEPEFLTPTAAC